MTSIGVREFRQRASEYLRRVEAGETIQATDRGRPIALLTPIPDVSPLDRLRAVGDVESASADLSDLPEPLGVESGRALPSEILARLRANER